MKPTSVDDALDWIEWYVKCLVNVTRSIPVRDLPEAHAGYLAATVWLRERELEARDTLAILQREVGGCREWIGTDPCNTPAEYVLWGKLLDPEALGPRCYDCAAKHVGHRALSTRRGAWAIVNLRDLAKRLDNG